MKTLTDWLEDQEARLQCLDPEEAGPMATAIAIIRMMLDRVPSEFTVTREIIEVSTQKIINEAGHAN